MLDYWLWRRQVRLNHAATFWTATFFALPGLLAAWYVYPVLLHTIDGLALFWHGAGAGAGLGVGLAVSLRGVFREASAEWFGCVLGLMLCGGAAAIRLNAEQPEAESRLVAAPLLELPLTHGRRSERTVRRLGLRSVMVEWQGRPQRIVVDSDLVTFHESEVVFLLSVYDGRFGFPVVEQARRVEDRER